MHLILIELLYAQTSQSWSMYNTYLIMPDF